MRKFLFLFFLILFLVPNVYASEYNMNSKTSATKDGTKNRYRGVEIYQTGMPGTWTFGSRYTGKLSTIETYFDYPFEANTTYTLTYNMNTEDFRNNFAAKYWWDCEHDDMNALNQHVGSFTYVSYKKVKFSFTPEENTTCIRVLIGSSNQSSQAITGISNWRLDSITLYDPDYQSGSSGIQGSTSPTPTPSAGVSNQDIINNQNNNTQDIINNNNQNTQDIIENNNENTNKITDSINNSLNNRCDNLFNVSNYLDLSNINSSGEYIEVQGNYVHNGLNYIPVTPLHTYTISSNIARQWVYNFSSDVPTIGGSGSTRVVVSGKSISFTVPVGYSYFVVRSLPQNNEDNFEQQIMLVEGSTSKSYCAFNSNTSNKLDDINNSINNDDIDDKTGFFTDFEDNDHGLTSIITLPLSTIQSLTSSSCVALSVPIPFTNSSVNLPCMSEVYQSYIPSIYNIWQVVSFGIIAYFICLDIYRMVKGFKDPNEDKVEVLDL